MSFYPITGIQLIPMKTRKSPGKFLSASPDSGASTVHPVKSPTRRVLFDVHIGGAREVYLAGSFNQWHSTTLPMVHTGAGRWEKEVLLPPGDHQYLLIADGRWIVDPQCQDTIPNPFGSQNCIRHVE